MLIARALDVSWPVLRKRVRGRDVSDKNAFSRDTVLALSLRVPRALGARGVVLRLHEDKGGYCDLAFLFSNTEDACDHYTLSLPLFSIPRRSRA